MWKKKNRKSAYQQQLPNKTIENSNHKARVGAYAGNLTSEKRERAFSPPVTQGKHGKLC